MLYLYHEAGGKPDKPGYINLGDPAEVLAFKFKIAHSGGMSQ